MYSNHLQLVKKRPNRYGLEMDVKAYWEELTEFLDSGGTWTPEGPFDQPPAPEPEPMPYTEPPADMNNGSVEAPDYDPIDAIVVILTAGAGGLPQHAAEAVKDYIVDSVVDSWTDDDESDGGD